MSYRRIMFTSPNVAELVMQEDKMLNPNQVRVELAYSTISSGTERANLIGDPNVNCTKGAEVKFPRGSGYSASGVVIETGEAVKVPEAGRSGRYVLEPSR